MTAIMPKILRQLPGAPDAPAKKWKIAAQYIIDDEGCAVFQWGSYTTRRNAELVVLAKRFEKELRALSKGKKRGTPRQAVESK